MTLEQAYAATAVNVWKIYLQRAEKFFFALDDGQLQQEIAPGKNRLIYLFGHLIAVHDAMFAVLGLGERLHPELDAPFLTSPDRAVQDLPSAAELQRMWTEVHSALTDHFARLTPAEWLQKHTLIADVDFAANPLRNRLSVMLTRVTHMASHLGQTSIAPK
jgi:hypothetical protein